MKKLLGILFFLSLLWCKTSLAEIKIIESYYSSDKLSGVIIYCIDGKKFAANIVNIYINRKQPYGWDNLLDQNKDEKLTDKYIPVGNLSQMYEYDNSFNKDGIRPIICN
tara:strand:+ start:224 stop:550 length:327 start_codon:yes stop_codon:yes gene_type:complete